jgi:hypothetical protein
VTLRWKSIERSTRRRVREAVRESESLRTEYKLARKAARWRHKIQAWFPMTVLRCSFPLLLLLQGSSSEFIIAVILVLTLGAMFFRASQLFNDLYCSTDLIVYDFLPISNHDIFTVQWRRFLRRSLWSVFDFTMFYSALLLTSGGDRWNAVAAGLGLGLIQWLFIVAAAVCLFAFGPRKYFAAIGGSLVGLAVLLFFFGMRHPLYSQWFSHFAWLVPPGGWILQALGFSGSRGLVLDVLPGLIAACVLALAPIAFQRVRREFEGSEPRLSSDGRSPELQEYGEQLMQKPEQAGAVIQNRQFLDGFDWEHARFVERFAGRLLNSRERVVAEFMVASNPGWTRWVRIVLAAVLIGVVVGWTLAAGLSSVVGTLMFLVIYFAAVSFIGTWRGFLSPPSGGLQSPIYAVYPIGYWELMRVVLKVNLARIAICVPFVLAALVILAANPYLAQTHVFGMGIKLVLLGLMAQPIVAFGPISPGTNDTQELGRAVIAIIWSIALLGAGITFFMAWNSVVMLVAGLAMTVLSVLALTLYGRWFNGSRIDLVPLARMENSVR